MAAFIFYAGCGNSPDEKGPVKKINKDDKSFKGTWIIKKRAAGQQEYSAVMRIDIILEGNKFQINEMKSMQNSEVDGDRWVYNGKTLKQIDFNQKQLKWIKVKRFDKIPFWKMSPKLASFKKLENTGEDVIAGRKCSILEIKVPHAQGEEIFMYWVDEEKNIVLKKMHILSGGGFVLVSNIYECKSIEFDPFIPEDSFEVKDADDYVSIKKLFVSYEPLETNF